MAIMGYHAGMGRWATTFAAVGLVLVAAAPVTSEMAGGPSLGKHVPGLGSYAGGRYCITQDAPFKTTTTPDEVTVWTVLGQGGTYSTHDAGQVGDLRVAMERAIKIEECWEGK